MTKTITRRGKKSLAWLLAAAMILTLLMPMQVHAASYTADATLTFSDSGITASGAEDG